MKTLTLNLLIVFLSVLCISCASVKEMTSGDFWMETGYRLTVAGMIDGGECIPIELKIVVLPKMNEIQQLLDSDNTTPQMILNLINQIQIKYTHSLLLKEIMQSGLTIFLDKLTILPRNNPIPEPYLTELKDLLKSHKKGVESAIKVVADNEAWCE